MARGWNLIIISKVLFAFVRWSLSESGLNPILLWQSGLFVFVWPYLYVLAKRRGDLLSSPLNYAASAIFVLGTVFYFCITTINSAYYTLEIIPINFSGKTLEKSI